MLIVFEDSLLKLLRSWHLCSDETFILPLFAAKLLGTTTPASSYAINTSKNICHILTVTKGFSCISKGLLVRFNSEPLLEMRLNSDYFLGRQAVTVSQQKIPLNKKITGSIYVGLY